MPNHQSPGAIARITTSTQFREALSRLRLLEQSPSESTLGRERAELERAVSRYLATSDDRKH